MGREQSLFCNGNRLVLVRQKNKDGDSFIEIRCRRPEKDGGKNLWSFIHKRTKALALLQYILKLSPLLRVSAVVGSDLGGDVQAVCAVEAVARTDPAGPHTLSRERLFTLLHLEGLAGARQHWLLQPVSVASVINHNQFVPQSYAPTGVLSKTQNIVKQHLLLFWRYF